MIMCAKVGVRRCRAIRVKKKTGQHVTNHDNNDDRHGRWG
jgi:hypothetical protein